MLSMEDCIALSELSEAEIEAIARHEHIPQIAAAEMGNYLIQSPSGEMRLRAMIVDDIREAQAKGDQARVLALKLVCRNYLESHPLAEQRKQPRG